MIKSVKTHLVSFNTYASFIAVNCKRKPYGGDTATEQGCMIHLTADEAKELGDAVPEIDFNIRIKTYNEREYLERFKAQAPSGYEHNGLIRVMSIRRESNTTAKSTNDIELFGNRSRRVILKDPQHRTAVNITLEVYPYEIGGNSDTGICFKAIEVLEA